MFLSNISSMVDYAWLMGSLIKRMCCLLQLCVSKCPDRFATLLDAWNTKNWEYFKQFCKPGFEIGSKVRQRSVLHFCKRIENSFTERQAQTTSGLSSFGGKLFNQIFASTGVPDPSHIYPLISKVVTTEPLFECALRDRRKWASSTVMHITAQFCQLAAVHSWWRWHERVWEPESEVVCGSI